MGKFPLFSSQKRGVNSLRRGSEGGPLSLVGPRHSRDRFKPIESIPFRDLALSLLALLALGTGRRIGDLTELSRLTF